MLASPDPGTGAGLPTGSIEIGFWCGVPESELKQSRFDEIAEAGFTLVTTPCADTSDSYGRTMIDLAAKSGLGSTLMDSRLLEAAGGSNVVPNLDAVVAEYQALPGLRNYLIFDEPPTSLFSGLATAVSGLASSDPAHPAVVNLFPIYASAAQLGTSSYDTYVAQFLSTVHPASFTYDHYNFLSDGSDHPLFFQNLAIVRAHAVATNTPFGQYIQSISFNGHRIPTASEKRWAAMHTIAYGGKAVLYFTYWTPTQTAESFGDGLITLSGTRTAQYAEVREINNVIRAMGKYLGPATSTAVFHNGPLDEGTEPRAPGAPIYIPSGAAITVGLFSIGNDAYALLVNRDHRSSVESDVYVASADGAPELLDINAGSFSPATVLGSDTRGARLHVSLPAGDGTLLHMRGPVPAGAPGAEAFMGSVRCNAGTLDVVDSSFGTQRVTGAGWNTCPQGYTFVGSDPQSNGFWLCARQDLATRTFYVGNVVNDHGTLFRVQQGTATSIGDGTWDTCPAGQFLGRRFDSNGFWVCLE